MNFADFLNTQVAGAVGAVGDTNTFNLLDERWIPVRRRSGVCDTIAPHELADAVDPPLHLASPRSDFDAALAQFLIGLIQTCAAPEDRSAWRAGLKKPPTPSTLAEAFAPYRKAFNALGPGPRFLQDLELSPTCDDNSCDVQQLLIEAPGQQTREQNTDLFVRSGVIQHLSLPMTVAALLTLQLNAPSGGRGYRTSLRGGGPLTTLARGTTLWETVWLNISPVSEGYFLKPTDADLPKVFPWLAPCRTSEAKDGGTLPSDVHPLQVFWGTSRRVRLCPPTPGVCSMTGVQAEGTISHYNTVGLGVNYTGPFEHPLTPYREPKPGEIPLPVRGGASAATFMDWPSLALGGAGVRQARCVQGVLENLNSPFLQLWVTGFEMDNAKALRWVEATSPMPSLSEEHRTALGDLSRKCVKACAEAQTLLRIEVRNAIARRPKDMKGDFSWVDNRYEADLEAPFFARVSALAKSIQSGGDGEEEIEGWLGDICDAARRTFDQCAQVSADLTAADLPRLAKARSGLRRAVNRDAKKLRQTLGLPETR